MKTISIRRRLLAGTIVAGAMLGGLPAMAQVANDPAQASAGPLEGQAPVANADGDNGSAQAGDVVVTGSRIRSPNLEATSPITVVNSEEFKLTGTTRTEDLINSLPQAFAGQSGNISNGSSGIATINLRGLGAERNLVLVNGRRVVPGDPSSAAVDINVIPAAIIKRVDVLTGGASSVYGADAVTGVVNFVMDTDFEGFRLDGQYSMFNHNNRGGGGIRDALNSNSPYGAPAGYPRGMSTDGGTVDVTAAFGTSFDDGRGHITAYGGYRKINAVSQANRDYSSCSLSANTASAFQTSGRPFACAGSATSPQGTFRAFTGTGDDFATQAFQPGQGQTFARGSTPFNFNPLNYYQRPDERYTAGFFANYEVSDAVKPYAEFMFMDDRTVAQIAPSGNFGNTTSINCNNPLLSAQQLSIVCAPNNLLVASNPANLLSGQQVVGQAIFDPTTFSDTTAATFFDPVSGQAYNRGYLQAFRRNVEGGARRDDLQHTSFRGVIGSRGDLGSAWSYDAYYQYGRTNFAETYTNDFSITRLGRALDVVSNPNGGAPVCRSVLTGQDPNCVPYNIFSLNSVTPESVAYLSTPGFQRGVVSEQVASASFSGQLGEYGIKSPWATEGLGLAIGAEYRKESLDFKSDLAFQTGDLSGQGAATLPVQGSFDVKEVFGELRVPIVFDSFIYNLSVTGGYRYSSYSTSVGGKFSTDTYKIEGEFAPIRDIRFRGGYNRAVRAPTVQDLFAPQRVALSGNGDPCAGRVLTAADQGCLLQGLRAGQTVAENPSSQYNGLIGGNPNLLPEVADTYTAGVVLQPSFLPRFALTVDFFDINIKRAVTSIGVDTILNACNTTLNPQFCGLVNRDAAGSLWLTPQGFVTNTTQNIGGLATRGIDVSGSYSYPIGDLGSLGFNFNGTWLDRLVTDTGISGKYDCVGLFGTTCLQPTPEWRHNARVSFNAPSGVGVSVRWRYFGNVKVDATNTNPNLNNPGASGPAPGGVARPGLAELGVQSYFDLAMTFRVSDAYTFRLGANNLLDREPPLTGSQACPGVVCNGNTFPGVYDALGRYIYAGVTLDL